MRIRGEQEGLQKRVFSVHDEQEMMMERKCMLQYLYARIHVHRATRLPQEETFVAGVDVDSGRNSICGGCGSGSHWKKQDVQDTSNLVD